MTRECWICLVLLKISLSQTLYGADAHVSDAESSDSEEDAEEDADAVEDGEEDGMAVDT